MPRILEPGPHGAVVRNGKHRVRRDARDDIEPRRCTYPRFHCVARGVSRAVRSPPTESWSMLCDLLLGLPGFGSGPLRWAHTIHGPLDPCAWPHVDVTARIEHAQHAGLLIQETRAVHEPLDARSLRGRDQVPVLEAVEHGDRCEVRVAGERDDPAEKGLREVLRAARTQDPGGPEPLTRLTPVEGAPPQPARESLPQGAAEALGQLLAALTSQAGTQPGPRERPRACRPCTRGSGVRDVGRGPARQQPEQHRSEGPHAPAPKASSARRSR